MAYSQVVAPRRATPLVLMVVGCVALTAGVAFGSKTGALGAAVFVAAVVLALRDLRQPVFTWTNALALFVLIIWFVPIRLYRLPVELPFGAELFRVVLIALGLCLLGAVLMGRKTVSSGGQLVVLVLLVGIAAASQIVNADELSGAVGNDAAKALSSFLTYVIAFVLVCSVVTREEQIDTILKAMVLGGVIIAAFALIEAATAYNPFTHLNEWLPGFIKQPREIFEERGGRARVFASAQHPIALGCALTLIIPLALYVASQAATAARRWLWLLGALIIAASALATISKTVVVMAVAMFVVGIWLRGFVILRLWPLLLALPIIAHIATPGALGGLWKSFFPDEGLVSSLEGREGLAGSGRLGDFGPAVHLWEQSPIIGKGIGALLVPRNEPGLPVQGIDPTVPAIVFDNQYLTTFVEVGLLGLIALVIFVWGTFLKTGLTARHQRGARGDRLAACAAAGAGFAASLFVFDTFAFVQCTLLFFMVAALGLRARQLATEREASALRPASLLPVGDAR